jgi:hypothetical protein
MAGSAEDRLEVLNRLIDEGEQYRDEQVALVETQTQCGQDATAAEAECLSEDILRDRSGL